MAYSTDLREKIVRAYDDGHRSQRAVAELFGVSRSFVEKLLRRRRPTGEVAACRTAAGASHTAIRKRTNWCTASSSYSPTPRSTNSARPSSAGGRSKSAARP